RSHQQSMIAIHFPDYSEHAAQASAGRHLLALRAALVSARDRFAALRRPEVLPGQRRNVIGNEPDAAVAQGDVHAPRVAAAGRERADDTTGRCGVRTTVHGRRVRRLVVTIGMVYQIPVGIIGKKGGHKAPRVTPPGESPHVDTLPLYHFRHHQRIARAIRDVDEPLRLIEAKRSAAINVSTIHGFNVHGADATDGIAYRRIAVVDRVIVIRAPGPRLTAWQSGNIAGTSAERELLARYVRNIRS